MTRVMTTAGTVDPATDERLVDDLSEMLREERRRAPADLLVVLAGVIGLGAVGLLVAGLIAGEGPLQDLLLNLTAESVGAILTVILIGGLWAQVQRTSFIGFDSLARAVEARRGSALAEDERRAFGLMLDLHRRTQNSWFLLRLLEGVVFAVRYRSELKALEDILHPPRR